MKTVWVVKKNGRYFTQGGVSPWTDDRSKARRYNTIEEAKRSVPVKNGAKVFRATYKPVNKRDGRVALGLCAECGHEPNAAGKRLCGRCAGRKHAEVARRKAAYAAIVDACLDCGAPATYCRRCEQCNRAKAESNRSRSERTNAARIARKAAGLCTRCGAKRDSWQMSCLACLAQQRTIHAHMNGAYGPLRDKRFALPKGPAMVARQERIMELHKTGMSYSKIAEQIGVSKTTIAATVQGRR